MEKQIEELKSQLQRANKKIQELEAENDKVNELWDKAIKNLEKSVEGQKQAELEIADLRKRKDEILSSWSNECDKNKQLKNSLKAVATLINTILA